MDESGSLLHCKQFQCYATRYSKRQPDVKTCGVESYHRRKEITGKVQYASTVSDCIKQESGSLLHCKQFQCYATRHSKRQPDVKTCGVESYHRRKEITGKVQYASTVGDCIKQESGSLLHCKQFQCYATRHSKRQPETRIKLHHYDGFNIRLSERLFTFLLFLIFHHPKCTCVLGFAEMAIILHFYHHPAPSRLRGSEMISFSFFQFPHKAIHVPHTIV
ncbi:hypothetical protein J6590_018661 [Homalodisca vitripennis]|nr:hypothetical protein J6590_018661 [Homalodisca vitripennis]